jgi:hypothetical protein
MEAAGHGKLGFKALRQGEAEEAAFRRRSRSLLVLKI